MNYIHKEGRIIVWGMFLAIIAIHIVLHKLIDNVIIVGSITAALVLFWLAVTSFFRNPKRPIIETANQILAPADGKIVVIEETVETEYHKDKRIQVSIFMSPANVHVNRVPVSGSITYAKYHPGKFLVAWHPKASTENERTSIVFKHGETEFMVRQIAGAVARRIRYYVKAGDTVKQGEDFGFIKFGSRVDLYLPLNAKIKVQLGQTSIGNQTVIAELE